MPIEPMFDYLLAHGLVAADDLHRAVRHQEDAGTSLDRALLDLGLLDEPSLAAAKAAQAGVAFTDLAATPADPRAAEALPAGEAARLGALPVALRDGALVVAVADPGELQRVDEVARLTGRSVVPAVAPPATSPGRSTATSARPPPPTARAAARPTGRGSPSRRPR